MASALAFPQQTQQHQSLPVQTVNGGDIDNNLLGALARYVTTGPGAKNTTEAELKELASNTISKPGGKAHLEALVLSKECHPDYKIWKYETEAAGTINLGKTGLSIDLNILGLELSFKGKAAGFFVPYSGQLSVGKIYYDNDQELAPGPASFKLHVIGLTLYIEIYRNNTYVGCFVYTPITFTFNSSMVVEGSGTITQPE
ncbi:hypothetical protein NM208_g4482 [Fusarium decemcellulare]|uniref:Uncharacterized protein n=2 Tax=Fusarium decemcellulare TaxID=57161 RepID=A0ACC1SKI5_9HYPO|nr:hypothetical protein NM208_g5177 [Fusarium decemcellulare]KAJ3541708.1 hypothetical protein NM208_g4482 [Fusarium decemcellulare]